MYKYMNRTSTCTERGSSRSRDRRASPRYPAVEHAIDLGWREGSEFRTAPGSLRDISHTGAAALLEVAPPDHSPLWVRLSGETPSEWIEVTMVRVEKSRGFLGFGKTSYLARWKFTTACPYDLFSTVINGANHGGDANGDGGNDQDRLGWR